MWVQVGTAEVGTPGCTAGKGVGTEGMGLEQGIMDSQQVRGVGETVDSSRRGAKGNRVDNRQ